MSCPNSAPSPSEGRPLEDTIAEARKKRFLFLRLLYDVTHDDTTLHIDEHKLGAALGFSRGEIRRVVEYLADEGLIARLASNSPGLTITHAGVVELELAVTKPDEPTDHFGPVNITYVGRMTNSQIQQSSPNAIQSIGFDMTKLTAALDFVRSIRKQLQEMGLTQAQRDELMAEAATIEAQAASPKPKPEIVAVALRSIKAIIENVAGGLAATYLAKLVGLI